MSEETKTAPVDDAKVYSDLLERREKRLREREKQAAAFDRKELELEDKYEDELGPRGQEFEIVNLAGHGPIVIRRGEMVLYKRFQAAMSNGKDPSPEDVYGFVWPCIAYPEKSAFDAIVDKRPHIAMRLANALLTLMGAKEVSDRGKF